MKAITTRQLMVLDIIRLFIANYHFSPTVNDIARRMGVKDTTAHGHLLALRRKNQIVWEPGKPRSIRLVEHKTKYIISPIPNHSGLFLCRDEGMTAVVVAKFESGQAPQFVRDILGGVTLKVSSAIGSTMFLTETNNQ